MKIFKENSFMKRVNVFKTQTIQHIMESFVLFNLHSDWPSIVFHYGVITMPCDVYIAVLNICSNRTETCQNQIPKRKVKHFRTS